MTSEVTSVDFWRQLGIVTPSELAFPINIIGAGGIGSPTALFLAKMGCSNISIMDDDVIEAHNFPNQMFRLEDIDKPKAFALAELLHSFTGIHASSNQERFDSQDLSGVTVVCVDNMESRNKIWKKARLNMQVPLLIDGRMGGQIAQVFAVNPCDPTHIKSYEELLYTDEESVEIPCTEQAIIYNTLMIASIICNFVKCFAKREALPLNGIVKLVDSSKLVLY